MKSNLSKNPAFCYYAAYALAEEQPSEKYFKGKKPEKQNSRKNYSISWFYEGVRDGKISYSPVLPLILGEGEVIDPLRTENVGDYQQYLIDNDPDRGLNDSQRKAIQTALSHPLTVIEGPPGTGKTMTIVNLMSCIIGLGKTVAMVSFNTEAVDNVAKKIGGFSQSPRDSAAYKLYQAYAPLGNASKRAEFYETAAYAAYLSQFSQKEKTNSKKPNSGSFLKKFPAISSTIHSVRRQFIDSDKALFDYVIMDESSQTRPDLGMIAASCARHLVLVGDAEQLPSFCDTELLKEEAVVKADAALIGRESYRMLRDLGYHNVENNSFFDIAHDVLTRCRKEESDVLPIVMLNVHYRCHPKIIGFCNQAVYGGRMTIKSTASNPDECPIRVWYFNGDYNERCYLFDDEEQKPTGESHHNPRQLAILKEKEFDSIFEKLMDGGSVCILTPYRGQLNDLHAALLAETNKRLNDPLLSEEHRTRLQDIRKSLDSKAQGAAGKDAEPYGEDKRSFEKCVLTVHKSQGKEYDTVYLLPVEDGNWMWPWSHSRCLINVAVSRAKQELVIITSTALMSETLQRNLGIACPIQLQKKAGKAHLAAKEVYLKKLLDYVWEECKDQPGDYGFHPSGFRSVFDEKPLITEWVASDPRAVRLLKKSRNSNGTGISCEELALFQALNKLTKDPGGAFKALYELPIKALFENYKERIRDIPDSMFGEGASFGKDDLIEYIENGASCDFVVLDRWNVIQCVIEVQGAPHRMIDRFDPSFLSDSSEERFEHVADNRIRDEKKRFILQCFLGAKYRFLCWSTDSSVFKEYETDHLRKNVLTHRPKKATKADMNSLKPFLEENRRIQKALRSYSIWKANKAKP